MSKLSRIEINFAEPVNLPDGFEQTLSALVNMVCEQYQRENPERVMWPAGHGTFGPDDVYSINVDEREDFGGQNHHNPRRDELRAAAYKQWRASNSRGAFLIRQERERQLTREGWSKEHDLTEHGDGSLALAATCYLEYSVRDPSGRDDNRMCPVAMWPFERDAWKPGPTDVLAERIREAVKGGALAAAAIDVMLSQEDPMHEG